MSENIVSETSIYAADGTLAHAVAAKVLRAHPNDAASNYIGERGMLASKLNRADTDAIQEYVDFCLSLPEMRAIEMSVPIGHITGEQGAQGTIDYLAHDQKKLWIVDYKHGRGVRVDSYDNPQLELYALGALDYLDLHPEIVELCIYQPRARASSSTLMTPAQLEEFRAQVRKAADATREPDAPVVPGPHQCRWCPAAQKSAPLELQCDKAWRKVP
jgi:hypothetical protein